MAQPIYKMFYLRMKEAWFQLSQDERDTLFARMDEAMQSVGGKSMLLCNSSWNSEQWWYWGVEEFPSIEAVQEYTRHLADLDWFRYCDSQILLGTRVQSETS